MREIKFRVWDTYRNKMIKWDELRSDSNYLCLMVFDGNGYRTRAMQYTGLKDKNGREIYEGDIVELTNTYKGMNTKSIVEIDFIDFTFAGKWKDKYSPSGYMYNPLGSYNFPIVTIEVIGNIYENPELLSN